MSSTYRYQPASSTRSYNVSKVWLLGVLVFGGWAGCQTDSKGLAPQGGQIGGAAGAAGQSGATGGQIPDAGEAPTSDAGILILPDGAMGGAIPPRSSTGVLLPDAGGSPDAPAGLGGKMDVGGLGGRSDTAGTGGTSQNAGAAGTTVDAPLGGDTDTGKGGDTGNASDGATGGAVSSLADAGIDLGRAPDSQVSPDSGKADASPWTVVWFDDFNADKSARINRDKWNVVTWDPGAVNEEKQKYTESAKNLFYDGEGHLVLRALRDPGNANPYTSARIQTDDKFAFKFGRIEIRAKLPAGKGSFPGMLLMGSNGATWPQCGEIGLMEQYGNDKNSIVCSTYANSQNDISETYTLPGTAPFSDQFHVFALEWYQDHMVFFVDDTEVARRTGYVASSPFANANNDFYIILDVALGGKMGGAIDDTAFPMDMVLDYIRVSKQ